MDVGLHLDLHDIAACWCSDEAGADVDIVLAQRTDVPWPGVVVDDLLVVRACSADGDSRCELPGDAGDGRSDGRGECSPRGDSESS